MSFLDQYAIQGGKLARVKKPIHRRPWLMALCIVLALLCGAGGTVYFFSKIAFTKEGHVTLSQEQYDELINLKNTQIASEDLIKQVFSMPVTPDQLGLVIDSVYDDVRLSSKKRKAYVDAISKWSSHYSMPPLLVLAMVWRESTFDESVVSSANARGPMQVIYRHHYDKLDRLGKKEEDLHSVDTGIAVGVEILREYYDRYDENIFRALAAYVGGQHRTYAQDIMTRYFRSQIFLEEHKKNQEKKQGANRNAANRQAERPTENSRSSREEAESRAEPKAEAESGEAVKAPATVQPTGFE